MKGVNLKSEGVNVQWKGVKLKSEGVNLQNETEYTPEGVKDTNL